MDSGHELHKHASFSRQALAALAVYCLSMTMGAGGGFSGVALIQVASREEGFNMDNHQISWFASLVSFASIPTCLVGGFMGEWLGRKTFLCFVAPLFITGNLCTALAQDLQMLYFGRLMCGAAFGLTSGPAGVYMSEITTPEWRTTFNAGLSTFYMIGVVFIYTLGKWLHWRTIAGLTCLFPAIYLSLAFFIPESPAWLITQGRRAESRSALIWLRGRRCSVDQELTLLEQSYKITQQHCKQTQDHHNQGWLTQGLRRLRAVLRLLRRPDVWKPLVILTTLMLLQQFSGMATISSYAVSIMEQSGSSLDKYTATIIFGVIRLAACFGGSYLLSKFSRRLLLVVSSLLVSLGMALLGIAVFLKQEEEDQHQISGFLGYLPLISANLVALAYQTGLGPIPWSYTSELYPVDLRSRLSGISNCLANLYIFLTIKSFPTFQEVFKPYGAYWFYSSVALCAAVFGSTILPDTRGKTLAEVSDYFTNTCCIRGKQPHQQDSEQKEAMVAESNTKEDVI